MLTGTITGTLNVPVVCPLEVARAVASAVWLLLGRIVTVTGCGGTQFRPETVIV
jgi:hypothetical protein